MNHKQIQLNVLLLCLFIVLILLLVSKYEPYLVSKYESFLSKREMRKKIYGFYDDADPDEDMNDDNLLLRYLDK